MAGWLGTAGTRQNIIDSGLHPELHITYRKLCNVTTWMRVSCTNGALCGIRRNYPHMLTPFLSPVPRSLTQAFQGGVGSHYFFIYFLFSKEENRRTELTNSHCKISPNSTLLTACVFLHKPESQSLYQKRMKEKKEQKKKNMKNTGYSANFVAARWSLLVCMY